MNRKSAIIALCVSTLFASAFASFAAEQKTVIIAFDPAATPEKTALADNLFVKETGYDVEWRKFETGPEILAAMASGSVQIGLVGSSPIAVAATKGLPVKLILQDRIGTAEQLVAREGSGIAKPDDLRGKKIGVPFGSTSHYSLLGALKHWGIAESEVTILNLPPTEIVAAWSRGDIDAAYTWAPALTEISRSGKKLTDSAEVGKWGTPAFNGYIVLDGFSKSDPQFVQKFVDLTIRAREDYDKNKWPASSPQVLKISKFLGIKPDDAVEVLSGLTYPTASDHLTAEYFGGGTAQAIKATAEFLKDQHKLDDVLDDYSNAIDPTYIKKASEDGY